MWETLNSPFALTLISLLFGAFVTSKLSQKWQNKKFRFELQIAHVKRFSLLFQKYFRILKSKNSDKLSGDYFDEIHSELISLSLESKVIFKSERHSLKMRELISKLANARNLTLNTNNKTKDKLIEAQDLFEEIILDIQKEIID